MRRTARTMAAVAVGMIGALLPVPPAAAQPDDTATPPTGRAPLMIVLDASGSMELDADPSEEPDGERMSDARNAIRDLVDDLPADTQVGLVVYGTNTGHNSSEERLGCQDVTVLRELQPLDTEAIGETIEHVQPSGYSPIGMALRTAAHALPDTGPRNIVLVSDAYDYCTPPDPCEVAGQLTSAASGLAISTIGVHLDAEGRRQLACIADAGGGQFIDAGSETDTDIDGYDERTSPAEQLRALLTRGFQRPTQQYRPAGTEVSGYPEASTKAPVLAPGDYRDDTLSRGTHYADNGQRQGTVRYYRLGLASGMTPWVSATVVGDVRASDYTEIGLQLRMVDADGDDCVEPVEASQSVSDSGPVPVLSAQLGGIAPADWAQDCSASAPVFLRVERLGGYRSGSALPVEIVFRAEPPVGGDGGSVAAHSTPPEAPEPGEPVRMAGGSGFGDAAMLTPESTIADTIVAGETRYYAVALGWGQQLSYRVRPTGVGTPVDADDLSVQVSVRNPLRAEAELEADNQGSFEFSPDLNSAGGTDNDDDDSTDSADDFDLIGGTTVPVAHANRASHDAPVRATAIAGTYYLQLTAEPAREPPGRTVPFTLTVAVSGEAGDGPGYRPASLPRLPTTAATTTSDHTGPSTDRTASAAASAASGAGPAGQDFPGWLWAVGGAAAALLLAAVIGLLLRRRPAR